MHEQLDSDLKKRIAAVFENYEEPGADEGWLRLREKFPEEKKDRRGVLWFWLGAAAVLLLVSGIGLWLFNSQITPERLSVKKNPNNSRESSIMQKRIDTLINNNKSIADQKPGAIANRQLFTSVTKSGKTFGTTKKQLPDSGNSIVLSGEKPANTLVDRKSRHNLDTSFVARVTAMPANHNTHNAPAVADKIRKTFANSAVVSKKRLKLKKISHRSETSAVQRDSSEEATDENQIIAKTKDNDKDAAINVFYQKLTLNLKPEIVAIQLPVEKPVEPKNSIYTMFAADQHKAKEETIEKNKKVQFGIYEATYLNYAKGSDNQVNLGLGVSSDIYISKNLKLITGIAVGRNSLNYAGSATLNSAQNYYFTTAITAPGVANLASDFTPATAIKNYNAGMVNLDIPINLKYEFNAQKNNWYVLAGLSSGTFINETYTYQYIYPASSAPYNLQTMGKTTGNSFNSFYFAKTVNFAIGAGLPFGKNSLIFEPFLKYPIGGLGSQDIHFGTTGLNLKFKFK